VGGRIAFPRPTPPCAVAQKHPRRPQVQIIRSKTNPDYKAPYTTVGACVKATLRENGFKGPFQVIWADGKG
jgi:hypothetical protein